MLNGDIVWMFKNKMGYKYGTRAILASYSVYYNIFVFSSLQTFKEKKKRNGTTYKIFIIL